MNNQNMKIRTEDRHKKWARTRIYSDRIAKTLKTGIIIIKKTKKTES